MHSKDFGVNFGTMLFVFEIPEGLGMPLGFPVIQRRVGMTLGQILEAKWMPKGLIWGILGLVLAPFLMPFGYP